MTDSPIRSPLIYQLISSVVTGEDFPGTVTYGIRIGRLCGREFLTEACVEDIAPDREAVCSLCRLMEEEQLEPVHLRDVTEDFLSCPSLFESDNSLKR